MPSPSSERSLPIKLPKIAIAPIPKLSVKKDWFIADTITLISPTSFTFSTLGSR